MATKKQKREAAQAKRDEFMAGVKASGLAAQQADRNRRIAKEKRFAARNKSLNSYVKELLLNHFDGDEIALRNFYQENGLSEKGEKTS
jgi:hypothetical protein